MGQSECKGCTSSDPATDTVKVNVPTGTILSPDDQVRAEADAQQAEDLIRANQDLEAKKEEHDRIREDAERAAREREEREAAERRELEARESKEKEEQEAKAQAKAKEEQEAREKEEAEKKDKEAANARLMKDAEYKSENFCKNHGFKAATAPKTSCFTHTFPLHVAVKENNPEAVKALMTVGADSQAKNFSGKTPMEMAKKLNKNDSHKAVISALGGA